MNLTFRMLQHHDTSSEVTVGVWKTRKSGSGTGTGEINEWFKLGSMIDINTLPPLSAFLARWMTIR